ncbi:hypothetical protein [Paenibacillus sp. sgz302251]|uniref:hypothetical protein n=1 Tax=Paenibacillus sp. sgz302251 TaxID=3414493 RepID=UPI003C7A39FF
MIRNNAHKYSVSAMCEVLQLPRRTYYYKPEPAENEGVQRLEDAVVDIFTASRNNYGTRKIKVELCKRCLAASRRLFVDLFNCEIIGCSSGPRKTAEFVYKAISGVYEQ